MTKVHPNTAAAEAQISDPGDRREAKVLTVWKKSLLFNCTGFTVFDAKGNLVFRVDNYAGGHRSEIVLMDAAGKPLLSIRPKRLSLGDRWLVFNGEESANPRYSVRKNSWLFRSESLARVTPTAGGGGATAVEHAAAAFDVEGSYSRRCCTVLDEKRCPVAEIQRKESAAGISFGVDVFRLVVEPQLDPAVAMSLVILLEQMFGSRRRFITSC